MTASSKPNDRSISPSEAMFFSVTSNAFDFLRHAIRNIEKEPKYSLISFVSAVELFLKARLLLEHWSLAFEKPGEANATKFHNGDFISVGMDEAVRRLNDIVGSGLMAAEAQCFGQLRIHRNRLVHFCSVDSAMTKTLVQQVASDQCKGWLYLHRLLTEKWAENFTPYHDDIEEIHQSMKQQRRFLQARFEQRHSAIEKGKARGRAFRSCPSCGFEACLERSQSPDGLFVDTCLVCDGIFRRLRVACPGPNCQGKIYLDGRGERTCDECGATLTMAELINLFAKVEQPAFCGECSYMEDATVVPVGNKWICLNCLTEYESYSINRCEWCGERVTGEVGDYYSPGCVMCQVHIEREATEMDLRESEANGNGQGNHRF